ncbi:MAG TPA: benzoate-CoA ligase family protein [Candidatus Elarobacter sp.]|jgi:benzoate-CoA ligase|nr:benzoate-CoA ligase family protein [Candidatus Elarobacter sp.]
MIASDPTSAPAAGADRAFYNAAADLLGRNLPHRAAKTAFVDEQGAYTYGELAERVDRCAGALLGLGIEAEQRVVLGLLDTIDFPTAFLGAIKAGIVPIPVNTLFQPLDLAFILADSRAKAAIVSAELLPQYEEAARLASWRGRFVVSDPRGTLTAGAHSEFAALLATATPLADAAPTRPDDVAFWLYSSGSTGKPKGTLHVQTSLIRTAELFAQNVLGMREDDVVYSAAKLFFAYGLGNALSFPMSVGATAVLCAGRPTPDGVSAILRDHRATIFCGVPTLFAALLVHPALPRREELALRLCTSAGEPLPEELGRSWTARFGVEIIDGIGSTEMLHIFVSNRPGAVKYGTTGLPVPGYRARIVGEDGREVERGELGELEVAGDTSAILYWNNRERSRRTFVGEWTRTGDKFRQDEDGCFVYCGRVDDMLKVSGIWVSPSEVESALVAHESVLEAAVVGAADEQNLIKPKAFVVLKPGVTPSDELVAALQAHVKSRLAPYKYPRWIAFVPDLPKTATGKIRRHVLRDQSSCAT